MASRFLVAKLQVEALKGCASLKSLRKVADTLPSGLNAIYAHAMRRIEAQGAEKAMLAKLALLWVSQALRPLRVDEVQDALATHYEQGTFQFGSYDGDDIPPSNFIVSICCGLLEIERQDGPQESTPDSMRYFRLIRE